MASRLLIGCAAALLAAGAAPAQTLDDPLLRLETVVSGLARPTTLAFLGPDDLLVLEKDVGRVRRVVGGVLLPDPVLDVAVNNAGERGLLGIAINGESPPHVFLYFTEQRDVTGTGRDRGGSFLPEANRVYRYQWNPTAGALVAPLRILDLPENLFHSCHKGGILTLGPPGDGPGDGADLHVLIGDLGLSDGQLTNRPEAPFVSDRAVVLRVEQDGSPAHGNPFTPYCETTTALTCRADVDCPAGERCLAEVARYFAYGIRNGFGMALDPVTGDLWDTENGPFAWDEINRLSPGANSGWITILGPEALHPQGPEDLFDVPGAGSTYVDPAFAWRRPVAPTAIVFPHGSALGADYDEVALVADFNNGQLYRFPLDAERSGFDFSAHPALLDRTADDAAERDLLRLGSGFAAITDLKVGPDGALYVSELLSGRILRIRSLCPAQPAACREPLRRGGSRLRLGEAEDDEPTPWKWTWRGAETLPEELGDPLTTDAQAVCVYDATGLVAQADARPGGDCGGRPCWRETPRGFRFRDRGAPGLRRLELAAGRDGRARLSARGVDLGLDSAALAQPVTVQLHQTSDLACFGGVTRVEGFDDDPADDDDDDGDDD